MVAKIKSGKSLIGALNYNENKVKQGKATLIAAVKYFKDPKDLSFNDKLFRRDSCFKTEALDPASENATFRNPLIELSSASGAQKSWREGLYLIEYEPSVAYFYQPNYPNYVRC